MLRELGFSNQLPEDSASFLMYNTSNPEDFYIKFIKDNNITELDDIFNRLDNLPSTNENARFSRGLYTVDNLITIDVNRLALGEGKKFIDIYGNLIPQALKKIGREQYNIEPKTNKILLDETDVTVTSDEVYQAFQQRLKEMEKQNSSYTGQFEPSAIIINNKLIDPQKLKTISLDISPEMKKPLKLFAKGGLVVGEDNVPFTKEDPADRVDPFTGTSYKSQMEELGL